MVLVLLVYVSKNSVQCSLQGLERGLKILKNPCLKTGVMVIASFRGMVYLRGKGSDTVVYKIFQHNLLYRIFSFQPTT